jgi:hypothetical protein
MHEMDQSRIDEEKIGRAPLGHKIIYEEIIVTTAFSYKRID